MSKRKSGFTLVELLVVMIIISMLVGIAIPAVMMARERARRMTCANNLANLGKALQEYEISKKQYPGWINNIGGGPASWPVTILKNIDRADIYDLWREGVMNVSASEVQVSTFVCPSSGITGTCPLSYVANCGQQDAGFGSPTATPPLPPDWTANGVFFRHYCQMKTPFVSIKVASTDIADGLQYTLLLSENLQAGNWANIDMDSTSSTYGQRLPCDAGERLNGMIWWLRSGTSPVASVDNVKKYLQINKDLNEDRNAVINNSTNYNYSRPSSYHPGGVNAVFCDGHTQFLDEQMEYNIFAKLMATDDKQVKFAGSDSYDNPFDIRSLLSGKLTEDDLQ